MIKIGDIIICHTPVIMTNSGYHVSTINNKYTVNRIDKEPDDSESFMIIDDSGSEHWFMIDVGGIHNRPSYKKWFWDLSDYRDEKIEILLND